VREEKQAGRVAVVTGGGTGIGRAIALGLAGEGARVVIVGRREEKLLEVAAEAADLDGEISPFVGDVADARFPSALRTFVGDGYGRLDVLIHNAGIFAPDSLDSLSAETFDRQLAINLRGPLFLTQALVPLLQVGEHASVVMVSSNLGVKPIPNTLSYSVSKAALNHAVLALATELGPLGIRVNGVSPGVIDTPIHDRFGSDDERKEYFETLAQSQPIQRVGQPEDVAHVVLTLAAATSVYVCGANVIVDGGLILT
jgi:NAD(P)-dependent dehydrogenase (short-subunit alcohol dehydrogenase family)